MRDYNHHNPQGCDHEDVRNYDDLNEMVWNKAFPLDLNRMDSNNNSENFLEKLTKKEEGADHVKKRAVMRLKEDSFYPNAGECVTPQMRFHKP